MPGVFDAASNRKKVKADESISSAVHSTEASNSDSEDMAKNTKTTTQSKSVEDNKTEELKSSKRAVNDYSSVLCEESPSSNPFHAFAAKPQSVAFDTQHSEEEVILMLRQHPITQVGWVLTAIGLSFVPFLVAQLPFIPLLPEKYVLAGLIGWYALVFTFIFESFLMWFFNVYIITDERVIDVDFASLVYKNISAAKLENIEDITAVTGGALQSIFNYGTVKIQTAGANTEFEFEAVPQPAKVTAVLNELLVEEEREKIEGRVN